MQTLCDRLGIKFLGIHFIGSNLVPEPDLDEKTEDKRFKILETEQRWVTNIPPKGSSDKGCIFCNLASFNIVKENELFYVIYDQFPVTQHHALIIPKRHVQDYFQLNQQEVSVLGELLQSMKSEIQAQDPLVTGFNIGMNCGADAGQTVMHCHTHLIPRRQGDIQNPRGGVRGVIPSKQAY